MTLSFRKSILLWGMLGGVSVLSAQENFSTAVSLNLTTEGLYNLTDNKANWITILDVNLEQRLWRSAHFTVDLLSVYNQRYASQMGGIADHLHIFSAIEDESIPLALFMCGVTQRLGPVDLFVGVRNVNRDYFTSPWNSLFTASTNGLFPIISHNYPLSDSPLSALCLHAEWGITPEWRIKSSLYNGVAAERWDERFRFRPAKDGVLSVSKLSYEGDEDQGYVGSYHLGFV
ncbi:MAG: hypothetical protein PHV49_06110, partial [Alistipes sp.]|nr:hypothetical protein [Alistipes sp.]